jgi:glutaredoxin
MDVRSCRLALAAGALAGVIAVGAAAQTPPIYRYVDPNGRVVYSDHMPPANSKNVESKRLTQNYIETDKMPLAAKQARDRFPVTLYTFDCGELCDKAQGLLNRRGVPYRVVDVKTQEGVDKLQKITGDTQVPVLQAGDKLLAKGFSEARWQALLDDAGYPKAPAPRRTPQPPTEASKASGATPAPAAAPAAPAAPVAQPAGGGYPKL